MFRIANLVMVLALLATAAVVYQVKYASTAEAERLAHLRSAIRSERDQIAVMRAEWARRTAPLYVQGLVQRHLDLQPLDPDHLASLDDLPAKPAAGGDGIGGMIEALVDAPLTTSSTGNGSGAAKPATPSERATSGSSAPPAASSLRPAGTPVKPPAPRAAPSASRAASPVAQMAPRDLPPPQQLAPQPQQPAAPANPFAALGALLPPGLLGGQR